MVRESSGRVRRLATSWRFTMTFAGVNFCSIIPNHSPLNSGGTNSDYRIEVFEAAGGTTPVITYTPGAEYRVRISKNPGASDIKGVLMGAFNGMCTLHARNTLRRTLSFCLQGLRQQTTTTASALGARAA